MMRLWMGAFVFVLWLTPMAARAAGDLTLRDVIELHRSGLGAELLVAVVEADGGPFTLGFADIQDLKAEGISERVIAALVRTGRSARERDDVPAVSVEQHVTTVVPSFVVVGPMAAPDDGGRSGRDRRDDHRRSRADRDATPPATWITRREDGRNIAQEAPRRHSDKPAATWVTPNSRTESPRRGDEKPPR